MGGSSKQPKPPPPTPEEKAMEKRTNIGLRRERAETERMLKAQARGQLGAKSLLTGLKRDTSLKQEDVVHSKKRGRRRFSSILDAIGYALEMKRTDKMRSISKSAQERSERKRQGTYKPAGKSKNRIEKMRDHHQKNVERQGKSTGQGKNRMEQMGDHYRKILERKGK